MLQKFAFILSLAVIVSSCADTKKDGANATENSADSLQVKQSFYPDTMIFDVNGAITVADLKNKIATQDSLYVKVSSTITETCTKMGCWMDIKDEAGNDIKVRMKDHNFFVPVDGCEGKKCVIEGLAYRTIFTEEERLHYAMESDMSQEEIDKIKGDEEVLTITAYKVMIEDAPESTDEHNHEGHDHDHEGHEHHDHESEEKDAQG